MTSSQESNLQYFEKTSQKQTLHFKVPSSIDFYLMRSYAGNLPQFWKFVKDGITNRIQKQVKRWI